MSTRQLDTKSSLEVLVRCCVVGQSKGAYSIKDASLLFKVINHLRGTKKDDTLKEKECYDTLVRATVVANGKGAYSLEEASLIDEVVEYLNSNDLLTKETPQETKEEKVV